MEGQLPKKKSDKQSVYCFSGSTTTNRAENLLQGGREGTVTVLLRVGFPFANPLSVVLRRQNLQP